MKTYTAEQVVVSLMNLRAQIAARTDQSRHYLQGADDGLTMAVEDWRPMSQAPANFQDELAYILTESHILDLAHHAVQLFLENRDKHELEDGDNWNAVHLGILSELEQSDVERLGAVHLEERAQ